MALRFFPVFLLLSAAFAAAQEAFPTESPEHQALALAEAAIEDPDFSLRKDYWEGILSGSSGRALKLQFFKHNLYRLYLGVAPSELPPGGRLHLDIVDSQNAIVATATGEADAAAVGLEFDNDVSTGLFLVLMRIEIPPGPLVATDVPAVLFYGWK